MSPYPPKSANGRLRTIAIFVVALVALASLLVAASGGEARNVKATAVNPHLLLGITGNPARFKTQTGQDSAVQQVFLGWGQGVTYGSPLAQFLPTLAPIPMLHLANEERADRRRGDHARRDRVGCGRLVSGRAEQGDRGVGQGDLRAADGRDEQRGERVRGLQRERHREGREPLDGQLPQGVRADLCHPARRHGERDQRKTEAARHAASQGRRRPARQPVPDAPCRLEPARGRQPEDRRQRSRAVLPR